MAVLHPGGYHIKNLNNEFLQKEIEIRESRDDQADKKGFEHFMLKEIFEQPEAIENAFRGRLIESEGVSKLGGLEPVLERLKNVKKLIIVSCGTSYYAGLCGRYIFESLCELHVEVEVASEFRYRKLKMNGDTAVLALSQSGETADTIAAIREAKRKGALILGVVNVVGSAIAQITDAGVYNHAGPEFGVASTKIYTSQLVVLTLMALLIGRYQGLSFTEGSAVIQAVKKLPRQVKKILTDIENIKKIALEYAHVQGFSFHRPPAQLPHRHGGGAEAEGDLLHPRRRLRGRRNEARAHLADRREFPHRGHRFAGLHLRKDAQQHPGNQGAQRPGAGHRQRGQQPHRATCATMSSASPRPCRSCSRS